MVNFVVEFPLKTETYQEDILNKRFEMGRQIYNSLVNVTGKRYKEMKKTKNYRMLLSSLTGNQKSDQPIWKQELLQICSAATLKKLIPGIMHVLSPFIS
ncbi:MAG: hypothetical protein ACI4C1_07965 [Lachnospiraceae bacterium]